MDRVFIGIAVVGAILAARDVWRSGSDGPNWDLRWRALGPDEQAELAVAALSPKSIKALADPERRELAEGFARRERRRRAYLDVALVVALALAGSLTLAGVTHSSSFGLILAVYGLLMWPRESLRNRQIKRRARSTAQPDPATAA